MTSTLPPPPPAPPVAPVRRRHAGVWVGVGIAVFGVLAAIAWLVLTLPELGRRVDDLERAEADAPVEFTVDEPVEWRVFLEPSGLSGLETSYDVLDLDRDVTVAPQRQGSRFSYDWVGRSGRSVAVLVLDPGYYRLQVRGPGRIAIGPDPSGVVGDAVVGAALLGLPLMVGGAALAVVSAIRDTRRRTRDAERPPPSPWSAGEWPARG